MAIMRNPSPKGPHIRRDHGNPFQPVQSPKAQTTGVAPPVAFDTLTSAVISAPSTYHNTIQPETTTSPVLPSSDQSLGITATSTTSSISTGITKSISAPLSSLAIINISSTSTSTTAAATATTTDTAIAPLNPATSTSLQPATVTILSVLSLILGLLGIVILIITLLRCQARRKRDRSIKREVELLDAERKVEDSCMANAAGGWKDSIILTDCRVQGKAEEEGKDVENEYDEQEEQALPAYCR